MNENDDTTYNLDNNPIQSPVFMDNTQVNSNKPLSKKETINKLLHSKAFVLGGIGLILLIILSIFVARTLSARPHTLEVESGRLAGALSVVNDMDASDGAYVEIGKQSNDTFQPEAPYYASFYYPWYGSDSDEWSYWQDGGHKPPSNWFANYLPDIDPNSFNPATELYQTKNDSTLYWQLQKMKEAKLEVAISSWWGQDRKEDDAFNKIITDVMNRPDNPYPNLRWSVYYEQEGFGDPTVKTIVDDINYIKSKYASQPGFLKIDGKPVVFVYGDNNDGAGMADRWRQVREQTGIYTVLKVYSGYGSSVTKADSWHQYAPAVRGGQHGKFSYFVSPGFWKDGDPVRLKRDLSEFRNEVSQMVESDATWKLIETWNEWGEGTSVEPGDQVIQTRSGDAKLDPQGVPFKNKYIDVLNQLLPDLESSSGTAYASPINDSDSSLGSNQGVTATLAVDTTSTSRGFTFTAGGDLGADQPDTIASLDKINQEGSAFFLALGDMSYNDITPESKWCDFVKSRVGPNFPFQILVGNHEDDDRVDGYIGEFRKCLPDRMNSTGEYAAEYSFDYPSSNPLARVIMIGAQNDFQGEKYDYDKGSAHYNWLSSKIDEARSKGIKWIVVGLHKPCLTTGNKRCEISQDLVDLMLNKKVDLILSGHDHDYQRTKQLTCAKAEIFKSECVADSDSSLKKGAGSVWVISGHFGGGGFTAVDPNDSEAKYFASIMGSGRGYDLVNNTSSNSVGRGITKFTVTDSVLTGEMIVTSRASGSGDYFSDKFVISADGNASLPVDTTPPSVSITSPGADSNISGDIRLVADASDNVAVNRVEFLVDNIVKGTATAEPYELSLNTREYSDGSHSLSARVYDSAGLISNSATMNVVVSNNVAACEQQIPTYASSTMQVSVNTKAEYHVWTRLSAASSGIYAVWVGADNQCAHKYETSLNEGGWIWTKQSTDNSKPGTFILEAGSHDIKLASNTPGLFADSMIITSDANCVPVDLGLNCANITDTTAPKTAITAPTSGTVVKSAVSIIAEASDNVSMEKVEFYVNDTMIGTAYQVGDDYSLAWDSTRYDDGEYAIKSRAYDSSGNTVDSEPITIIVDNIEDPAPPVVVDPELKPEEKPSEDTDTGEPDPVPDDKPDISSQLLTLTYVAVADASIDVDEEDNLGKADKLEADGNPSKAFYLRFDADGIDGRKVTSAKVFLYNTNSSPSGGDISFVSNDKWSETGIVWTNAPAANTPFYQLGEVDTGRWYSVDVSRIVTKDGMYSFRVDSKLSNGADYSSRETANKPKLVLIVE